MKLVWPANCLDKKITAKVTKIATEKDVTYSKDHLTAYFPMINENTNVGYIVTKSTEGEIVPQEVIYLEELAKQAATTITRAKVYGEILKYATLDALTGFYNRRQLDERVKQEVSHAKRKKSALCAIMVDIDFFKSVNDTYGHTAGDLVLKTIAKIMRGQLREYDIAARYGGEEFMILLPYTSIKEAILVAERLRKSVKNKIIDIEKVNTKNDTKNINVTISVGLCEYKCEYSAEQFIMNTDKALYTAKETGRNRIIVYKGE
jgi:diguanylate cyclase (GGDEF)-like protein